MTRLAIGVLLWSVVHFIPALSVGLKKKLVNRFGENPYKGAFTVVMVFALYLIVSGWQSAVPDMVYVPPDWGMYVTFLLMLPGFILFFSPYLPKRMMRHPQLTGMACWGVGHLFANGDTRSIILFGGLTAWALIEIFLLNRRDGAWVKPARVPAKKDLTMVIFSVLVYTVILFTHHLIFGGTPLT